MRGPTSIADKTVTLILATYNEAENIRPLLRRVKIWGCPIIVVDDNSPDGTGDIARLELAGTEHRVLTRKVVRGLGSAIRYGAVCAKTPWVAVMDSDGQHDPTDLLNLISMRDEVPADVYTGSRLISGGKVVGLPTWRKLATLFLNRLGGLRTKTKASDYLTGLFVARTDLVVNTQEDGFKILYDILKNNRVILAERPVTLWERKAGESKANFAEIKRYLKLVFS
jgi:dolichol-phosphate mannosyltransferase